MGSGYSAFTLFLYNSCLGVFLSYGVFFTRVSREYNLPASSTSIVFGVFAVFCSFSSRLLGLFMNKNGPGKTILLGGGLMSAGLVFSSIANSFPLLIFTYGCVGGLGSGSMWMPTSYVVFDSFDQASVKRVTGFVSAGTAIGLLIFPPLENYLILACSIQSAFLVVGVLVFACTIALVLIGVGSLAGRLTAGVKSFNEETMAAIGFILQGACAAGLFVADNAVTIGVLSVLFGIGYGTYIPEFALLVRKYYGVDHYGTIFGILLTSFGIGAFIGPVFEGISVSSSLGYLPGFLLAALVSLAVGVHILMVDRKKNLLG